MYEINMLHEYVKNKDKEAIRYLIKEELVEVRDGKLFTTAKAKPQVQFSSGFWDQRQQARKILLNSLN